MPELTVSQQTQHGQVPGQTRSSKENARRNGLLFRKLEDLVNLVGESGALERLSVERSDGLESVQFFLGGLSSKDEFLGNGYTRSDLPLTCHRALPASGLRAFEGIFRK